MIPGIMAITTPGIMVAGTTPGIMAVITTPGMTPGILATMAGMVDGMITGAMATMAITPIMSVTAVVADTIIPIMATRVPSIAMAVRMATLQATGL